MRGGSQIVIHLDSLDLSEAFRRAVAEGRRLGEEEYVKLCSVTGPYRVTVTLTSISYDNCLDPSHNEYDFTFSTTWD